MASRARKQPATGIRLVGEVQGVTELAQVGEIMEIAHNLTAPVAMTEVTDDPRQMAWLNVIRWLADKNTKGQVRCHKAEQMMDALIRGSAFGGIGTLADNVDDADRRHGLPDFQSLKRGRFMVLVSKAAGTNKTRPIFGTWKLTDAKLLWACRTTSDAPGPIGNFRTDDKQIPHAVLTLHSNWVSDLKSDKAREAMLCDLLQLVSWKGEEDTSMQPFELVGHDIIVNETTLNLYGDAVNDAFLAARGIRGSGKAQQLGFPTDMMNQHSSFQAAQEYLDSIGARLFRESDGAVLDTDGDVLYRLDKTAVLTDDDDDDGPEENPDDMAVLAENATDDSPLGYVTMSELESNFGDDDEEDEDE